MSERITLQTLVTIDGASFILSPTQDAVKLCDDLEAAAASTGRVVRFEAAGDRLVRSLVTPHSHVIITEEHVTLDSDQAVLTLGLSGSWDLL